MFGLTQVFLGEDKRDAARTSLSATRPHLIQGVVVLYRGPMSCLGAMLPELLQKT
jgi:hypothetical protein